ncbi:DinB family protein [Belliella kenyensis]|uniref:DinB family protein n=1 Tax=Belliella kenyensis TaxID=1472724 RepID=A0ABV8EJR7_9BACT|nr:DinB family protein [Belliella kenyensis]MCH7403222.1 DinB family protein [Belliella kenyensis]MDN3604833.1 DinB family protein [Belliella kenyensis]
MNDTLKPKVGEYAPYYENYIKKVVNEDIEKLLLTQIQEVRNYFEAMGEEQSLKTYAEGKWTGKEVLSHIIDTDRVMTFRALCFARGEKSPLPSFDQDEYVARSMANAIPLNKLIEDFEFSRYACHSMFKTLPIESWSNIGVASGFEVSVRALFYIITGHVAYHLEILRERY